MIIGPIDLPWPDKVLSPNARTHWARKAKATKLARALAGWMVTEAMGPIKPSWERAKLAVEFCPPDRRRRDRDNLIASLKAATDGIADAIGIDDARFIVTYSIGEPCKPGVVRVTIAEADAPDLAFTPSRKARSA